MSTGTSSSGPRISAYMNLEQAMGEVRVYLEKKKRQAGMPPELAGLPAGHLAMQTAFITRLSDIATRLDQVEANSKLGAPGVFLKRLARKLIGWYSRPAQEFDRTTVEMFQQIRHDMFQLQLQIATLEKKIGAGLQPSAAFSKLSQSGAEQDELLRSMFSLFRGLMATEEIRQTLLEENPALLTRVDGLLQTVEDELKNESQVPGIQVRT